MKLQDDIRITGRGTRGQGTGDNQARAQELKDQMTQLTQENVTTSIRRIFQPLRREELVTKFKSRLKDRPLTVGSTGEGFPEFLEEPRQLFPHGVRVINPHQSSLAQLTAKCMEYVEENHAQHPAILFRGLPAETSQDFSTIVKEIPWNGMIYKGGTAF